MWDFLKLSFDDLLLYFIEDASKFWHIAFHLNFPEAALMHNYKEMISTCKGISSFYNLYLPWINVEGISTICFEKLVGPKGGGTREEQLQEIFKIANHLGLVLSQKQAEIVAENSFGGTGTFREGKIGAWKKHFKQKHKMAFKKVAGQLLIDLGYEKDFNW